MEGLSIAVDALKQTNELLTRRLAEIEGENEQLRADNERLRGSVKKAKKAHKHDDDNEARKKAKPDAVQSSSDQEKKPRKNPKCSICRKEYTTFKCTSLDCQAEMARRKKEQFEAFMAAQKVK